MYETSIAEGELTVISHAECISLRNMFASGAAGFNIPSSSAFLISRCIVALTPSSSPFGGCGGREEDVVVVVVVFLDNKGLGCNFGVVELVSIFFGAGCRSNFCFL